MDTVIKRFVKSECLHSTDICDAANDEHCQCVDVEHSDGNRIQFMTRRFRKRGIDKGVARSGTHQLD